MSNTTTTLAAAITAPLTPAQAFKAARHALENAEIETLEARNMDSLDFHDLGIHEITAIIREAYLAGLAAGGAQA